MPFTISDIKATIQESIIDNAAVALVRNIIQRPVFNEIAQLVADVEVNQLVTNDEDGLNRVYVAGVKGYYGNVMMLIDHSQSLSSPNNAANTQAAADAGLFGIIGRKLLDEVQDLSPEEIEQTETMRGVIFNLYDAEYNRREAFLSSQANEEALASGENIFQD